MAWYAESEWPHTRIRDAKTVENFENFLRECQIRATGEKGESQVESG